MAVRLDIWHRITAVHFEEIDSAGQVQVAATYGKDVAGRLSFSFSGDGEAAQTLNVTGHALGDPGTATGNFAWDISFAPTDDPHADGTFTMTASGPTTTGEFEVDGEGNVLVDKRMSVSILAGDAGSHSFSNPGNSSFSIVFHRNGTVEFTGASYST
jgi:hypothetical protein